ncbi:hypothetical protein Desdi_1951 [Desulfitobacterium dichloroeliminans LMG P-21439]|uniref:Uncharacterized protein n=1 Tax=Desulfitobacterium dichloroeliminans (strain LMG P-21439 / DCA1) TaxID=871963 RepID=L0F6C9_DESDL|nr:hypothetical protein [Desulfitobacterium dichloroeliminans]AGA69399.1 hypothetical protein Desdi_1951 [Desulfitobacterium dichloroeliminans LMG P-21439]
MKKIIPWGILLVALSLVFYPQHSQFSDALLPKMNSHEFNQEMHLQLPSTTQIVENWVEDREQLQFSATVNDEYYALRGYIQIWQLNDMEGYLQKSKEMSAFDFYTYSLNNIKINDLPGVLTIWGASFGELTRISGKEYWLKTPNQKVIRIAFLTSDTHFNEAQLKVMGYILSSLAWITEE